MRGTFLWRTAILAGAGISAGMPRSNGTESRAIDFNTQVAPILLRHCAACHNPSDHAANLNLLCEEGAVAGGDSGEPAIKSGNSRDSPLVARIAAGEMPPEGKGQHVSADDLAVLRRWIDSDAKWPMGRVLDPFEITTEFRAGRDWWSFKPPLRPEVPRIEGHALPKQIRNPIDSFICERLQAAALEISEEADRQTLIRRAMLDLHGLPPSPEEVQEFVADPSPEAHEKLIERLLDSPRYGERWARHWLDVARFAESDGFEMNAARDTSWPYRDYVIHSFNQNKPYTQFIIEQIAGDQVGESLGTGFLVAGPYDTVRSPDVELTRVQRTAELDDMVSATCGAFLGLTAGCAKCHDHKFDPIRQVDYYAIQAVFSGVQHRRHEASVKKADKTSLTSLPRETPAEHAELAKKIDSFDSGTSRSKLPMAYVGSFQQPDEPTFLLYRGDPMQQREIITPGGIGAVGKPLKLSATTPEADRRMALARWIADDSNPLSARVMVNRIWHYHFGRGLMSSPSDFGFNGGEPSHPQLLDWLATEFMAQ